MKFLHLRRKQQFRRRLLPLLALFLPAICVADESCPWLNASTAAGVLGGSVTTTVNHTNKTEDDAACVFSRKDGSFQYSLRIDVQTMSASKAQFASFKSQCHSHVEPLRAIGNEAVACSGDGESGGSVSEQVIGRVRDRAFIVRIITTDGSQSRDVIREKTRKIAEQVAGILF